MLHLMESAPALIPGMEKVIAVYYDRQQQAVLGKVHDRKGLAKVEDLSIASTDFTQDLRSKAFKFKWTTPAALPFETTSVKKRQLDIFDEWEHIILALGFPNPHDGQTDLLYLYLSPQHNNFGIPGKGGLNTNEKSIVGATLFNTLNFMREQQLQDAETLRALSSKVNAIQKENQSLKEELEHFRTNYQENLLDVCTKHMQALSEEYGCCLRLADDALEKIQAYNGNSDTLKEILTQSAMLALNLSFGSLQEVTLRAWDIQFDTTAAQKQEEAAVHERYQKTWQLLDKLETASRQVIHQNKKLTGENVGNACPQPISAPAISDALRNHQKKVISLMQNYPEHWPTIRQEFRPVLNILNEQRAG